MRKLILGVLLVPILCAGQSKQDSLWIPFKKLVGKWEGTSEGQPGKGRYERTYQFVLNKKFIEVKNKSVYPPSKENPKGETHEDIGYISYDKGRKSFVLRQFHVEGFVVQYKLESISVDGNAIIFLAEGMENLPPGFKARESYQFAGEREFSESFEVAVPGKDFEMYSRAVLRKAN